ncbi:MAG TPA: molybdopterin cofactor-binding domain-containing protein [Saprospiraceae bacterium]|nr:molybdopterin cofactor-binding domain-containing protein [Saprospiraceae bacterium]
MKAQHKTIIDLDQKSIPSGMTRRGFIKRIGGGVVIAVALSDFVFLDKLMAQEMTSDVNAYLRVGEDGRTTCFTGKIEMGQGVITSLAQMLAEELDVTVDTVDMVLGDTDLCPYDRGTWGSQTTRIFGPALRSAAAEARAVLIEMAAEFLKVSVDHLYVNEGIVLSKQNAAVRVSYAELTRGNKIMKTLNGKPQLKAPSEFKIIGKPFLRQDARMKVTGEAKYAGDFRLPGMLYARIVRPPAHGAKMISVDTSMVEGFAGMQVVKEDDFVALLHESPDVVEKAMHQVKAVFDLPEPAADDRTIYQYLIEKAPPGEDAATGGELQIGRQRAQVIVESEYHDGYYAHAPIEPHSATAHMEEGKMKIWASTQSPFGLKSEVEKELDLQAANVQVLPAFVGGGFGGKSNNKQGVEAARLAALTGKPVQVVWTRQEEFFYDTFRPAAVVKIQSGVDRDGKIAFWDYGVYFAGDRGATHFYDIANHKTTVYNTSWRAPGVHPFGTGAWRAPSNNTNTFARESQIDVMAVKAGMDPLDFRLKNLKDERMIRVLKVAADKFGWTPLRSPSGKGYGIACGIDAGSYVAEMAEVNVDQKTGQVKVVRVVCVQDMGLVINPQGATIQVEGCITMGLGYALSEEVKFTGGVIHTKTFGDYKIPRFSWVPEIETVLLDLPDEPAQGGGEPAIIAVGALIANAIYDACGARLYQMPMTPERVLLAMG